MTRRIALKTRDDPDAGVVILVVARTVHNRRVLAEHRESLRAQFPLDGAAIARELPAGRVPRESGSSSSEVGGALAGALSGAWGLPAGFVLV